MNGRRLKADETALLNGGTGLPDTVLLPQIETAKSPAYFLHIFICLLDVFFLFRRISSLNFGKN